MPKTKYTATFADGTVLKRSTDRTYSHAWRVTYERISDPRPDHSFDRPKGYVGIIKGFSGSEQLARSAAESAAKGWDANWRILTKEVVPTVQL